MSDSLNTDMILKQARVNQRFSLGQKIKSLLPYGIDGRFYLIILLPAVLLIVLGTIFFVQKHFDRVTRQMVANFRPQFEQILSSINTMDSAKDSSIAAIALASQFGMQFEYLNDQDIVSEDKRVFYDLSGLIISAELKNSNASIISVDLTVDSLKTLNITVATRHGLAQVKVPRQVLSPSNPHQFLILILFTGILFSLISMQFLRNQIAPIKRLASAAEAFGKGREYPLSITGATEVRSAIGAFIAMRDSINEQIEQRTLLLTSISHDLRTPLTRLMLEAELLDDSNLRQSMVDDITQMNAMLDQLLDFTSSGKPEPIASIDLPRLVNKIVDGSTRAGFDLDRQIADEILESPGFYCRPVGFRRLLENLLSNAAKYASRGRLSIDWELANLIIVLEDNGPGINEDMREKALQPFTRLDNSRNLNQSGSVGLGLAIVSSTVKEHDGTLELDQSPHLGGLRVTIKLPAQAAAMDERPRW